MLRLRDLCIGHGIKGFGGGAEDAGRDDLLDWLRELRAARRPAAPRAAPQRLSEELAPLTQERVDEKALRRRTARALFGSRSKELRKNRTHRPAKEGRFQAPAVWGSEWKPGPVFKKDDAVYVAPPGLRIGNCSYQDLCEQTHKVLRVTGRRNRNHDNPALGDGSPDGTKQAIALGLLTHWASAGWDPKASGRGDAERLSSAQFERLRTMAADARRPRTPLPSRDRLARRLRCVRHSPPPREAEEEGLREVEEELRKASPPLNLADFAIAPPPPRTQAADPPRALRLIREARDPYQARIVEEMERELYPDQALVYDAVRAALLGGESYTGPRVFFID
eukprot:gene22576-11060_t